MREQRMPERVRVAFVLKQQCGTCHRYRAVRDALDRLGGEELPLEDRTRVVMVLEAARVAHDQREHAEVRKWILRGLEDRRETLASGTGRRK